MNESKKDRKNTSMNDTLMLDVSQAHELKMGFRRHDYDNALIKQLSEGDNLGRVREFLLGRAEFKPREHIIDLDADPFIPNGVSIEEHHKCGKFKWDPDLLTFYHSEKQQAGVCVPCEDLCRELAEKPVLNANLLEYLIKPENQYLIPECWKIDENTGNRRYIFFWGTKYRDLFGRISICCMFWNGARWVSDRASIRENISLYCFSPALLFK